MLEDRHDEYRREGGLPAEGLPEEGHAAYRGPVMGVTSEALTRRKALKLVGAGLLGGAAFSLLASLDGAEAHPLRKQTRGFFNPDTIRIPAPPALVPARPRFTPPRSASEASGAPSLT